MHNHQPNIKKDRVCVEMRVSIRIIIMILYHGLNELCSWAIHSSSFSYQFHIWFAGSFVVVGRAISNSVSKRCAVTSRHSSRGVRQRSHQSYFTLSFSLFLTLSFSLHIQCSPVKCSRNCAITIHFYVNSGPNDTVHGQSWGRVPCLWVEGETRGLGNWEVAWRSHLDQWTLCAWVIILRIMWTNRV